MSRRRPLQAFLVGVWPFRFSFVGTILIGGFGHQPLAQSRVAVAIFSRSEAAHGNWPIWTRSAKATHGRQQDEALVFLNLVRAVGFAGSVLTVLTAHSLRLQVADAV